MRARKGTGGSNPSPSAIFATFYSRRFRHPAHRVRPNIPALPIRPLRCIVIGMALKKSELYSSLWASCDELRGGMDASQYKDYVLVLLFVKYVSDKYAGQAYAPIADQEADASTKLGTAQDALTEKVAAKYGQLTVDEIKTLVVDDKWLATLAAAVQGELDRVSQTLTGRIRQLAERYASPLPQITSEVAALETKVAGHLAKMGVKS